MSPILCMWACSNDDISYCNVLCMWTCRLGPADGGGDEGVGSNWSGVCHRPLELPPHVADMEGTVTRVSA